MNSEIFDGIIVLSNFMDSNGELNLESCLRADKAAEIYKLNIKSKVITCGCDYREDSSIKISDSMSNYLFKKHGIPRNNLIIESKSRDTVGEAVFTRKDIATKCQLKRLAIVTSSYHIERSKEIFEFVYGNGFDLSFFSSKLPFDNTKVVTEKESLNKFRDTFSGVDKGNIVNIYSRLIHKHPLYNRDVYHFSN